MSAPFVIDAAGPRFHVDAVAIDLDGTLLDTAADLAAAANAMLADLGRPALPVSKIAEYVGKGMAVLVHRVLSQDPEGRVDDALHGEASAFFLQHYTRENGRSARIYPGVEAGLDAMRDAGLRLAVVTNKPQSFSDTLLDLTGLAGYFDLVIGGDALPRRKPDPMPMLHTCERFGLAPARMLAIGDSLNDALAARAAGMPVLAVPYGYNEGRDVRELDVDAIVPDLYVASQLIEHA